VREDSTRHRRIRYRERGRTKRAGDFPALLQFLISNVAEGGEAALIGTLTKQLASVNALLGRLLF
jgi:hypothetical protein